MTGNYEPLLHCFFRNLLRADPVLNNMHYLVKLKLEFSSNFNGPKIREAYIKDDCFFINWIDIYRFRVLNKYVRTT